MNLGFVGSMADIARADFEGMLAKALRRAESAWQKTALADLREKVAARLDLIRRGEDRSLPASVIDEAVNVIDAIFHPVQRSTTEIAKRARDGIEVTSQEKRDVFVELAKEFSEMVEAARPVFRSANAEEELRIWHHKAARFMSELARTGDLSGARAYLDSARRELDVMLHQASGGDIYARKSAGVRAYGDPDRNAAVAVSLRAGMKKVTWCRPY